MKMLFIMESVLEVQVLFSENLATREEVDTLLRKYKKTEHKINSKSKQKKISPCMKRERRGFMHGDSFIETQKYPMKPSSTSSCKRSIGNMALTSLLISELSKPPCVTISISEGVSKGMTL